MVGIVLLSLRSAQQFSQRMHIGRPRIAQNHVMRSTGVPRFHAESHAETNDLRVPVQGRQNTSRSTPSTPSASELWMVLDGITVFAAAFFATVLGVADYPYRKWFSSGNSLGAGNRGAVEAFRTQWIEIVSRKASKSEQIVVALLWQNHDLGCRSMRDLRIHQISNFRVPWYGPNCRYLLLSAAIPLLA